MYQMTAQRHDILHYVVQGGARTSAFTLPRKIEKAADHIPRPGSLAHYNLQVLTRFTVLRNITQCQLGEASDGGEWIVQLMSNRSCHLAYRGKLCCLHQAVFRRTLGFHPCLKFHLHGTQLAYRYLQSLVLVGTGDYARQNPCKGFEGNKIVVSKGIA